MAMAGAEARPTDFQRRCGVGHYQPFPGLNLALKKLTGPDGPVLF